MRPDTGSTNRRPNSLDGISSTSNSTPRIINMQSSLAVDAGDERRRLYQEQLQSRYKPTLGADVRRVNVTATTATLEPSNQVESAVASELAPRQVDSLAAVGVIAPESIFTRLAVRYGFPAVGATLIVVGILLAGLSLVTNKAVIEQVKAFDNEASESSSSQSSNNKNSSGSSSTTGGVDTNDKLSDDPRAPQRLKIPSLDIDAMSTKVGLTSGGSIGAPANIRNVAWYGNSSSPLDKIGSSVIVGHVGSDRNPGVFSNLDSIQKGAKVSVQMANGKSFTYEVTQIDTKKAEGLDMSQYLSYYKADRRIIRLITCVGAYDSNNYSYDHRLIVTAKEVL